MSSDNKNFKAKQEKYQNRGRKDYVAYKNKLDELIASNAKQLDHILVTLSSFGLGASITVITKLVSPEKISCVSLLYLSWVGFVIVIVVTIFSLFLSQSALKLAIKYAEKYYLYGKENYLNKKSCPHTLIEILNFVSAVIFCFAVLFTLIFVITNFPVHVNSN